MQSLFFCGSHLCSHAHMAMATARNVQRGMELLPRLTSTPDNRMPAARTRRHLAELPGVGCRRPPLPLLPMQTRRWHDSRKGARKGLSPLPVLSARYRWWSAGYLPLSSSLLTADLNVGWMQFCLCLCCKRHCLGISGYIFFLWTWKSSTIICLFWLPRHARVVSCTRLRSKRYRTCMKVTSRHAR